MQKAIDIGCGLGNYSRELARMGFEMCGIDFSNVAIERAKALVSKDNLSIEFLIADFTQEIILHLSEFNFAFDYGLLHHIFPKYREVYARNVAKLLNINAYYLSIAFSEDDDYFGGKGKYRKTPTGSVLYFSNTNEIKELFSPLFHIRDLKNITIPGKNGNHRAYYALMQKR
ncbi:class I SAM-dependent methyltransferase [Ancylomarina sp. 16SWW S1-10-2]|uniref:class I SAM-dependent methyltransferase n=1 Tax=Ancylomarina sp. 16SWW S1-10-2 TaxID=2499681 RepID=UPI0012AD5CCA|nr:class I SAM-dependent methyltransferase [Ancylomarina sp. 16SWW S1-10-2]MRT92729.1 class I SAM-dependent methyltransferase [Ancylomarina sp. 16SWW S1-10-2]